IIGVTDRDILENFKKSSYVMYDLGSRELFRNNLSAIISESIINFLIEIILKAKRMDEVTGTDYVRNILRKTQRKINDLKNYLITHKKISMSEAKNKLGINPKDLPLLVELISLKDSFIKRDKDIVYYQL
ncbi:MAG: hypothetical protein ACTSQY_08620, partial [Candidatus Odinarchaeia archaeon]